MKSITLLAIETSVDQGSVALLHNQHILSKRCQFPNKNSTWILNAIDELLKEAALQKNDLHAVAFGQGPGSFTGIRLAKSIAQAITLALSIPIIPVSSLQALAQQAFRRTGCQDVLVAVDARLNQVYWGCYQYCTVINQMKRCGEERLDDPDVVQWLSTIPHFKGIGSGWDRYQNLPKQDYIENSFPVANDIATIAHYEYDRRNTTSPSEINTLYIRDKVTHDVN